MRTHLGEQKLQVALEKLIQEKSWFAFPLKKKCHLGAPWRCRKRMSGLWGQRDLCWAPVLPPQLRHFTGELLNLSEP